MTWLANALSLSRAFPLAPLIVLAATREYWATAFWILVVGALTDALDGWAARKFGSETQAGKDWIDPICDALLAVGAFLGLIWGDDWALLSVIWGVPMMILGLLMKWLKQGNGKGRRTANWLLPLCEWSTFYIFGLLYARRAFGSAADPAWLVGSFTVLPLIIYLKRERWRAWFAGRR